MFKVSFLRRLATLMLVLAGVALLTGWGWGRSAQLIQLVRPTSGAEASLFGTAEGETSVPGTPIGSPQTLIIRTTGAFLPGNAPVACAMLANRPCGRRVSIRCNSKL